MNDKQSTQSIAQEGAGPRTSSHENRFASSQAKCENKKSEEPTPNA